MTHSRSFFVDYVPPPNFLIMPSAGIDISDDVIRFVQLKKIGPYYGVDIYGEKWIEKDIIEAGYIKNKEALTAALKEIRTKHNFHFIRASLPEEKSFLFKTQLPRMPLSDIRNALQFKIEENVPVHLEKAVYDYKIMEAEDPTSDHIDLGVTVVNLKVISAYSEVLQNAGFMPLALRTESHAISHIAVPAQDNETCIVAALRETKTVLMIVSRGVIQFTSNIPVGGSSIANSLKKQFSVSDEVATNIRKGTDVRDSDEMFMSLVNAGSVLRDEIQKLFTYWLSHGGGKPIRKIILSGSDTLLGIDSYLKESFSVPVVIAEPWKNIIPIGDYIPPMTRRESLDYLPALGLALPYD